MSRLGRRALHVAEEVLYVGIGLLLLVSAVVVLVGAAYRLAVDLDDGVREAIEAMLDALLITFILVELLSAVRATPSPATTERERAREEAPPGASASARCPN